MFRSSRAPYLALRFGLAAVFLWFGAHKFVDPVYWLDAWVPEWVESAVIAVKMSPEDFVILNGIFEVLVGVSFISGMFVRIFASLALVFLVSVIGVHITSVAEIVVRDVGLAGALLALALWPDREQY